MEQHFRILCLGTLFCMNLGPGAAMERSRRFQQMLESGAKICALDNSSFWTKTKSRVSCGVKCRGQTNCVGFNYRSDTSCQLFLFEPQCFAAAKTCTHYQISDYQIKQFLTGIPSQNCSFPFSNNGSIHYGCTRNISNPCESGCFQAKRQWQTCTEFLDYVAEYRITDVTIRNTTGTTPLMTINNWIVIQQRIDGSVNFNRSWVDYKTGFGDIATNFWLGLEKMYQMTSSTIKTLRIEIQAKENGKWFSAEYDSFWLDPESLGYAVHVLGYSGDAGDGFNSDSVGGRLNGRKFATYDSYSDQSGRSCALRHSAGFWFNYCSYFDLNAPHDGIYFYWHHLTDLNLTSADWYLQSSRMMVGHP